VGFPYLYKINSYIHVSAFWPHSCNRFLESAEKLVNMNLYQNNWSLLS